MKTLESISQLAMSFHQLGTASTSSIYFMPHLSFTVEFKVAYTGFSRGL